MKKLILIDGNSIMFRAYYATAYSGNLMKTSKGEYTNALFAFANMFEKIVPDNNSHVLVAFDTGEPTFRHIDYDEYKAGRKEMPEELREQIPLIYEYINLQGIKTYKKVGYEADDIIGIYAKEAGEKGIKVEIYSSDRDLLQLVDNNITVHLLKSGMKKVDKYTPETLFEEFELTHDQIIDMKALMGDSSDNIPGVPGVGPKTAIRLLKKYKTIENIYENIDDLKGKLKENLLNNQKLVKLSKHLVTILTSGELDYKLEDLKREEHDQNDLITFLQKYELHTLVRRIDNEVSVVKEIDIEVIKDEESLKNILKDNTSIHFEYSDENYHKTKLWGIGYYDGKKSYFIDPKLLNSEPLKKYLSENKKYTYDYKANKVFSMWNNIDFKNTEFDLLLAAYLIDSHYGKEEFKYIVSKFDYEDLEYDETIYGRGSKRALPEDKKIYKKHIASKARAIYLLKDKLTNKLKDLNQLNLLLDIEIPLSAVLAKMEYEGINIDKDELLNQEKELTKELDLLTKEIKELANKDFNLRSPKQLGEVLFEDLKLPVIKKTKTGYSTNVDVLNKLKDKHEIIPKLLKFRELDKLYSTYIKGLQNVIFDDGKIHTIYKQALTTTGRLSSVEPNLQNISVRTLVGRKVRKAFISEDDYLLLAADYSQIELRILAHIANSKGLIEAFKNNEDIHTDTARKVFSKENINSSERRIAKAVNFGIIYGMQAWGLSEDLNITVKEAESFIEKYFDAYPEVVNYMDNIKKFAKENGYVETLIKRRRYIPELKSKVFFQRNFGERTALNAPIQGTAADIIKIAMIELDKYLSNSNKKSKLLLQVHDELILKVHKDELNEIKSKVKEIMNNAYKLKVDLKTNISTGKTWFDL